MKVKIISQFIVCVALVGIAVAETAGEVKVEITRISVEDNVYTPYYEAETVLDHEQGAAQKWIQLHVEYTTSGGWIDELDIMQLAMVTDSELGKPVILEEAITYINVKPGDHYANVYMHPSLVERYAVDAFEIDSAAIFRIDGKVVVHAETTKHAEKNWPEKSDAILHKGHLLNHTETPFWFINYDFKEIIKRGPHAHGEKK